jgi:hypothetical protein
MKKVIIASVAALGLALSGGAIAQTTGSVTNDLSFDGVDTDRNGGVSWAEFELVFTDISETQFNTADADGNGELSAIEFEAVAMSTGSIGGAAPAAPAAGSTVESLTYAPGSDS